MANALASSWRESLLDALLSADVKIVLLDSTYTYSAAHDNLNDVGGGARLATSDALTSTTGDDGYFGSDEVTLEAVAGGDTVTQIWLFEDSGVESTSPLIAYYDRDATAAMISKATDGGDIVVTPNASGWFQV